MNTENNAVETAAETAVAEPKKFLLHTRDADDKELVKKNFDLSTIGKPSYVSGLTDNTKMALMQAKMDGVKVVTTALPIDIASTIGEITIVRAWSGTKKDGSTYSGCQAPADFHVGRIGNREAFDEIKSNPLFVKAFAAVQDEEEEDQSDF